MYIHDALCVLHINFKSYGFYLTSDIIIHWIINKSSENVAKFKCLGMKSNRQKGVHKESRNMLNLGNA